VAKVLRVRDELGHGVAAPRRFSGQPVPHGVWVKGAQASRFEGGTDALTHK